MDRLEIRASRWQYVLFLLVALSLVAMGVALIFRNSADDRWVGAACVVFFGAGIPVLIGQLRDPRPRLVVDDEGITDRTIGVGTIRWEDILGAQLSRVSSTTFISLEVRNSEQYLARMSGLKRFFSKANGVIGYSPLTLNLSGLAVDSDDLLQRILNRAGGPRSNP